MLDLDIIVIRFSCWILIGNNIFPQYRTHGRHKGITQAAGTCIYIPAFVGDVYSSLCLPVISVNNPMLTVQCQPNLVERFCTRLGSVISVLNCDIHNYTEQLISFTTLMKESQHFKSKFKSNSIQITLLSNKTCTFTLNWTYKFSKLIAWD